MVNSKQVDEVNIFLLVDKLCSKLDTMSQKFSENDFNRIMLIIKKMIDEIYNCDCQSNLKSSSDGPETKIVFKIYDNYRIEVIFDSLRFKWEKGGESMEQLVCLSKDELKSVIVEQSVEINIISNREVNFDDLLPIIQEISQITKSHNYAALYIKKTVEFSRRISLF